MQKLAVKKAAKPEDSTLRRQQKLNMRKLHDQLYGLSVKDLFAQSQDRLVKEIRDTSAGEPQSEKGLGMFALPSLSSGGAGARDRTDTARPSRNVSEEKDNNDEEGVILG
ncbi:hypothetical protein LTR66_000110 [Elasticomyces elasticus]|nr:hypothetical protein LTR66_000110 [Elasticomyces elasticus]